MHGQSDTGSIECDDSATSSTNSKQSTRPSNTNADTLWCSDLSDDSEGQLEPDRCDEPVYDANTDITSYVLKNALFHLVGREQEPLNPDLDSLSSQERWKKTVDLTVRIFEYLITSKDTGDLPVYFLPNQCISRFKFEFRHCENNAEMTRQIQSDRKRRDMFLTLIIAILRAT